MDSMANYISIGRMYLALVMVLVKPLGIPFFAIYIVCGISDVLDGYIARKTHTTSKLGENLDSIADLIMVGVLLFVLYPIVNPTVQIIIWVLIIGMIRLISMLVVAVKYETFGILHTYGNKITGLMLFVFPLLLAFVQPDVLMYIVCAIASFSSLEELFIHLSSNEFLANRKGLFLK